MNKIFKKVKEKKEGILGKTVWLNWNEKQNNTELNKVKTKNK